MELFSREEHWKQLWKEFNIWFDKAPSDIDGDVQYEMIKRLIKKHFKLDKRIIYKADELHTMWYENNDYQIEIMKAVGIKVSIGRSWNSQKKMVENIVNFVLDNKYGVTISLNKFFYMAI